VRLTSGHSANGGIIDDFYLAPGAAFLGDINASSPPSNPPTSADSIWHKVADYSAPGMTAPTNLRMYPDAPSNYGAHSSFQVAWDWTLPTNGLNVGDFQVVLTDSAGNWYPGYPVSVAAGSRTYNFTGLNQNTQYQAYVKARYASGGRADSAWAGPLRWKTGADSYVVYDIPVYDWRNEFEYTPPYYYTYTSAALGDGSTWGFGKAIDGNFSSYWNSDVVTEPLGSTQGEGWMVQAPSVDGNGNSYLFTGIRAWTINPHTWWIGIYYNNAWQGGNTVYNGKYTSFRVPYAVGVDQGAAGTNPTIRPGNYQTNSGIFVAGLMQVPGYDGYNWRMEMIELRLLLMQWTLVAYNPRTVAAVNSGPW
jgi:hypothetical protein